MNIVLIDNRDSFVFNLADALARLGARVRTFRNSVSSSFVVKLARQDDAVVVVSPGPGRPEDAGCTLDVVRDAAGDVPVLGVCLGHQAIALAAGGNVDLAGEVVHGKHALLHHDGRGPFVDVPSPTPVARYHSLATRALPTRLQVHAALDDMAMAFSDMQAKQVGLQFHPESILSPDGDAILHNAMRMLRRRH